jgi:UDP-N-acetylglucosamine 2-epimerase (non-hydrolysing)/GDP/UDP-N,N'-diacetylbacillosamine 2-epimerase (hydrolysing)
MIDRSEELDLNLFVTGMHLSPTHGETVTEINADGFEIDYTIDMALDSDSMVTMAKSLGIGISSFAEGFRQVGPDIVLVLGDRTEAFAAGIAASYMNIPVAHIGGGQISGGVVIDGLARHALTKLSHVHFATSKENARRISQLGEEKWRIVLTGALGLDQIHDGEYTDPEELRDRFDVPKSKPLVVVLQHPTTTRPEEAHEQIGRTINAVTDFDVFPFFIYPNSDRGSSAIIEELERMGDDSSAPVVVENLPRDDFLGLLDLASVMVGNSSSGLIEAPLFGLPVIDVGPRQAGRQRGENVISVGYDTYEITAALETALHDDSFRQRAEECENPFYFDGAADRIHEMLAEIELGSALLEKETEL